MRSRSRWEGGGGYLPASRCRRWRRNDFPFRSTSPAPAGNALRQGREAAPRAPTASKRRRRRQPRCSAAPRFRRRQASVAASPGSHDPGAQGPASLRARRSSSFASMVARALDQPSTSPVRIAAAAKDGGQMVDEPPRGRDGRQASIRHSASFDAALGRSKEGPESFRAGIEPLHRLFAATAASPA